MVILEDTRQQIKKHELKHQWFEKNGIKIERCRLYVGDYTLANNQSICIDTKKDLQELCMDVCQDHERFKAELIRAKDAGIKLIILVEHGGGITCLEDVFLWQNPRKHEVMWKWENGKRIRTVISDKAVDGDQLYKSLCTIRDRYGAEFAFCRKEETGKKIVELRGGEIE